jgi:hypothetical protein
MKESVIEKKVCDYATKQGWLVFKCTGVKGVPDRILHKDGKTVYIEFKRLEGKTTPIQNLFIRKLKAQNIPVFVINSVAGGFACVDSQ